MLNADKYEVVVVKTAEELTARLFSFQPIYRSFHFKGWYFSNATNNCAVYEEEDLLWIAHRSDGVVFCDIDTGRLSESEVLEIVSDYERLAQLPARGIIDFPEKFVSKVKELEIVIKIDTGSDSWKFEKMAHPLFYGLRHGDTQISVDGRKHEVFYGLMPITSSDNDLENLKNSTVLKAFNYLEEEVEDIQAEFIYKSAEDRIGLLPPACRGRAAEGENLDIANTIVAQIYSAKEAFICPYSGEREDRTGRNWIKGWDMRDPMSFVDKDDKPGVCFQVDLGKDSEKCITIRYDVGSDLYEMQSWEGANQALAIEKVGYCINSDEGIYSDSLLSFIESSVTTKNLEPEDSQSSGPSLS